MSVGRNVDLGPTYRVVLCACYKDRSLKFRSDWCEWCQCRNCGGKSITKEAAAAYGYDTSTSSSSSSWGTSSSDSEEFNVDLGLVVLLAASVVVIFVHLSPTNSYVTACGMMAACFLLRDAALTLFFKKPEQSSGDDL